MSEDSVGFQSLISNGFGFFDLKVGGFDNIGHGESLIKDGVDDEFMVVGPGLAQAEEFILLRFLIGFELRVEIERD